MQPINLLEISQSALPGWHRLPHNVRWHVGAFPGASSAKFAGASRFTQSLIQPRLSGVRMDVADMATRLATAFPRLLRRVAAVVIDGPIIVRIECEGLHEGMWGDLIHPTWRQVSFEEQHEVVTMNGHIVSDDITLDIPGILNQVCDNDGIDPDETTRLGRAGREARKRAKLVAQRYRERMKS